MPRDPLTRDSRFAELLRALADAPGGDCEALREAVGERLGPYRIDALIGAGGMGVVYRATDERLDRTVALKLLPPRHAQDAIRQELLLKEAKNAAAVNHPNIAAIYDVGKLGTEAFIAMEYVEGDSLRAKISRSGMPWSRALDYALEMTAGLGYAHRRGIVHRDIKPDNIVLGAVLKILDFGLAEPASEAGGGDVGTRGYSPPEQMSGGAVDPRADVYAAGVVLHEMLTGRLPEPDAKSPRCALRGVPRGVARVVRRCLEEDPRNRYADGADLERALRRARTQTRSRRRTFGAAVLLLPIVAVGLYFANTVPPVGPVPQAEPDTPSDHGAEGGLRRVTQNALDAAIQQAQMSPDGLTLAYVEPRGLFIRRVGDDLAKHVPALSGFTVACASFFPDNRRLALQATGPGESEARLFIIDLESEEVSATGAPAASCISVSRDGSQLAWVSENQVLVAPVSHPSEGKAVMAVDVNTLTGPLAWSPGGEHLAVGRVLPEGTAFERVIQILTLFTGELRTVIENPRLTQQTGQCAFVWMVDGRLLFALAPWSPDRREAGLWQLPLDPQSAELRGEPSRVMRLPNMVLDTLSVSRDGRQASFLRFDSQADIYVASLSDGGHSLGVPRRLTLSDRDDWLSGWSPDGAAVLATSATHAGHQAFAIPLDSRVPRALSPNDAWATWPVIAAKSGSLFYWRFSKESTFGQATLVGSDADGSRVLYEGPDEVRAHGAGRPPTERYQLRCTRELCLIGRRCEEGLELFDLDPDQGTVAHRSVIPLATTLLIDWDLSPDGERIALVAYGMRAGIWVYQIDGSRETILDVDEDCTAGSVSWSDAHVLFASAVCGPTVERPYRIYRLALDGERSVLWAVDNRWVVYPRTSPDGRHLAFSLVGFDNDIWQLDLPPWSPAQTLSPRP